MDDRIHVSCSCGCNDGFLIRFDFEEEYGYVTISSIFDGFYAKQDGPLQIIKNRIKSAWFMLRGKEYRLHDIILNQTQWNDFVETVNRINGGK